MGRNCKLKCFCGTNLLMVETTFNAKTKEVKFQLLCLKCMKKHEVTLEEAFKLKTGIPKEHLLYWKERQALQKAYQEDEIEAMFHKYSMEPDEWWEKFYFPWTEKVKVKFPRVFERDQDFSPRRSLIHQGAFNG